VPARIRRTGLLLPVALLLPVILLLGSAAALAHPEDEFCTADSGLDPALCAALAEADQPADQSADGPADPDAARGPGAMLTEAQREQVQRSLLLERPWRSTAGLYIKLGFEHILPKGLDHILFVLALFLASTRLKPLLIQVSVFTLAHTLTLGLAAAGLVRAPGAIIEPLIAVSIVYVAVENLFARNMTPWRPLVVFGFGLFHGLGFASVLLDLGLPENQFLTALVSFNVGVELGQLTVILATWFLLHGAFARSGYRSHVVLPASALIALAGTWWAVQRIFL
jgi:hypothetical protein